jgi:hypothetical protein
MQRAMVNVANMSDHQIVEEVRRLLAAPQELQDRSDAFTEVVAQRYTAAPNMKRVVAEIKSL